MTTSKDSDEVGMITERMVETGLTVSVADVGLEGEEMIRHAVLDTVGCAVAGSREQCARSALAWAKGFGGAPEATVIGSVTRLPASLAALVNGTAAHALDLDDVSPRMNHPSAPVVPALMAASERRRVSGVELMNAYLAGFEIESRVCRAINEAHYDRGWHTTKTVGILGATMAVARLEGLDARDARTALGIAASSASGLRKNFGTMVKPLHAGQAARAAAEAVALTRHGFSADDLVMDGRNGYVHLFAEPDARQTLFDLFAPGARPELLESGVAFKRFACCAAIHTALDALERIVTESRIRPDDVERIDCRVNTFAPHIVVHHQPSTGLEGKFSLEYSLAALMLYGDAGLAQYTDEIAQDPRFVAMRERITVKEDPDLPVDLAFFPAVVTVTTTAGISFEERVDVQRGYPSDPLSHAELAAKFRSCSLGIFDEAESEQFSKAIDRLGECSEVSALWRELVPVVG